MPVKTKTESWVQHFRDQLKTFMEHKAPWYVQESRKKIRLHVIEDGKTQTLTLENTSQVILTELAISSCEGSINEIRIFQNTSSIHNEISGVKQHIRTINNLGREVNHTPNQILFYIYDDGSVEKKFVVE